MARMQRDLGALYNDHMNEAHTGEARYTARERYDRVRELLARGVLTEGLDLYHAGLVMSDLGVDVLHEVYEPFARAAGRGYPFAREHAAQQYDRWLRAQGLPQRFGSLWRWEGADPVPEPLADPAEVEALLVAWGLPTLAEEAQWRRVDARAGGGRTVVCWGGGRALTGPRQPHCSRGSGCPMLSEAGVVAISPARRVPAPACRGRPSGDRRPSACGSGRGTTCSSSPPLRGSR